MSLNQKKTRVLVVDDSAVARNTLINCLSAFDTIEIVGYAVNAMDAEKKIPALKPDVLTLDVEMPGMSGIEFLRKNAANIPPVILVSSLDLRVFDALAAGAVDFVRKPDASGQSVDEFARALAQKLGVAAYARARSNPRPFFASSQDTSPAPLGFNAKYDKFIIGIGASTGGTEAILEVMKQLPADTPGVLLVQHMPAGFTQMFAERLNRLCAMEVREAKNGDEITRGLALLAPADYQMRVVKSGPRYTVTCKQDEKVSGHRPSVDALFLSMAQNVKVPMAGVIMTGMGRDGASGLLEMRKMGAFTVGQDEASCIVYGMPMVAHQIGAVKVQASCENIAGVLLRHLRSPG